MRAVSRDAVVVAVAAAGLFAGYVIAGDVNPPAGPVAGTMKTLAEIEPRIPIGPATTPGNSNHSFIISQSGSYYLTGDVLGESGKSGIRFNAPDITLDLNGFTLDGQSTGESGVTVSSLATSAVLRNGHVTDWTLSGVAFDGAEQSLLENISSTDNGDWGIRSGEGSQLLRCVAEGNSGGGIFVRVFGVARDCSALLNGGDGFLLEGSAVLKDCRSLLNVEDGFRSTGDADIFSDCVATANSNRGFTIGDDSVVTGSTASGNTGSGFSLGNSVRLSDCVASNNQVNGIDLGHGSLVTTSVARDNAQFGFYAGVANGSSIIDCNAYSNDDHGVHAGQNTLVRGGIMSSNGGGVLDGAGVFVASNDARVEGVHAIDNDYGVRSVTAGSLIINCSASGNSIAGISIGASIDGPLISVDPVDQAHGNFEY